MHLHIVRTSLLSLLLSAPRPAVAAPAIAWRDWSAAAFQQARAEHKLVLLDLEAVWCHWCHVMDSVTYHDPAVIKLIAEHVVALKVDQDARPDLANRYENYGWPATILYASDGTELAKRSGYLPPAAMASMLAAFIADPTPGPSISREPDVVYATNAVLPKALQQTLQTLQADLYDPVHAGWGREHKFLEWSSAEYLLTQAQTGDAAAAAKLRATLAASRRLLDPVWGGVYQYSVGGDWNAPHFERIMQYQAAILRVYALAAAALQDPACRAASEQIAAFVSQFLMSPDGAFYTSMDADPPAGIAAAAYYQLPDAGRRAHGLPAIDRHLYSRENGWMIQALAELYSVSGEPKLLAQAVRASMWISSNRRLGTGGFRHDQDERPGAPFLGDTLAMGRAFLSLYLVTGDRAYLAASEAAAQFIDTTFQAPGGAGYLTTTGVMGDGKSAAPNRDEMIDLARYTNLLAHVTGEQNHRAMTASAMRYLTTPAVAKRLPTAGVLLAAQELAAEPTHITVVGAKADAKAAALFRAALTFPSSYKRVEWWDRREGPLRQQDVDYPVTKTAAAFACTGTRCSLPITDPAVLVGKVTALRGG